MWRVGSTYYCNLTSLKETHILKDAHIVEISNGKNVYWRGILDTRLGGWEMVPDAIERFMQSCDVPIVVETKDQHANDMSACGPTYVITADVFLVDKKD